jgi:hypothetical protein
MTYAALGDREMDRQAGGEGGSDRRVFAGAFERLESIAGGLERSVSTNGVDARVSSSRWAKRVEGEAVVFGSRAERSSGHWLVRTRVCLLGQVVRFGVFLDDVVSRARLDDALDFSDLVSPHDREEGRVSA